MVCVKVCFIVLINIRPSIIFIGKENGSLDVWDLFDNLGNPSHQHLVSAIGIKFLEMNKTSPNLLTVGDKDGCLHLLNLPSNLFTKNPNEFEYFLNFINKEKKRVSYYHSKMIDGLILIKTIKQTLTQTIYNMNWD